MMQFYLLNISKLLPSILPDALSNMIYAFYNSLQPCVRELQDWFGENSDTKNYHDNHYEAQASLILEFVDVDKYFPDACMNKLMDTDYFKSHQVVYYTDGTPQFVEIKYVSKLLDYLKRKKIPYEINLSQNEGGTMIDYAIPFKSDSE